jgi:D-lactate dehydrogenase
MSNAECLSSLSEYALFDLQSIFAADQIAISMTERILYAHDASAYRIIPLAIVFPNNEEQMRLLFGWATKHSVGITIRAAGTSLSGQAIGSGIIADISRSWKNIEIEEQAQSIIVQPGVIGSHANIALRPFGRKIGPDPASINACMMGGILANNSSGMCCGVSQNSYHTIKSLEFILPNGIIIDTSKDDADDIFFNKCPELYKTIVEIKRQIIISKELTNKIRNKYKIKNTVGYCLNAFLDETIPVKIFARLLIGSEGTLGFITKASLYTVPDLPYKATGLLCFKSIHEACSAIEPLKESGAVAVELMDRAALRSVENAKGAPSFLKDLPQDGTALLVEYQQDNKKDLQNTLQQAGYIFTTLPLIYPADFTQDPKIQAALWKIRKGLFPSVGAARAKGTGIINEDVAFPVDMLADAVLDLRQLFKKWHFDQAIIFGHAKDGNLHFVVAHSFNTQADTDEFGGFMDDLAKLVIDKYNGSLKAEHGTGRNISAFVEKEWGGLAYQIMKLIKNSADPYSILNPGIIINQDKDAHLRYLKPFPISDTLIDTCIECGYCESHCPTRNYTLSPRQRIILQREILLQDNPQIQKELVDFSQFNSIESCATDGLCALACPVGINTGEFILQKRAESLSKEQNKQLEKEARSIKKRDRVFTIKLMGGKIASMLTGEQALHSITRAIAPVFHNPIWLKGIAAPDLHRRKTAQLNDNSIIYIPACTTRLFAKAKGRPFSVQQIIQKLAEKARIPLYILPDYDSYCCGMPYASRGSNSAASIAAQSLRNKVIAEIGDKKNLKIYTDSTSCAARMASHSISSVQDISSLLLELLQYIPIRKVEGTAILHPACSARHGQKEQIMLQVAELCSENIFIPHTTHCCGFAGDHGFFHPQITEISMQPVQTEIDKLQNVNGFYSNNATCENGLRHGLKLPYESIAYLAAMAAGITPLQQPRTVHEWYQP